LVNENGKPSSKIDVEAIDENAAIDLSTIIEEHIRVINPSDRTYVAVVVPLAAGMEPLNPNLSISGSEAVPSESLTMEPVYSTYNDDAISFYYSLLPKGTYDFYFRTRANFQGNFIQPPATVEMMYNQGVRAQTAGATIIIK
ncbi:hypothetical protein JW979_07130, partial [bacterium]|nr:hypothetical protein [candidate division CSSED10-310 bacterium]